MDNIVRLRFRCALFLVFTFLFSFSFFVVNTANSRLRVVFAATQSVCTNSAYVACAAYNNMASKCALIAEFSWLLACFFDFLFNILYFVFLLLS